ncbi:MAG: response regulator, partial [Anaerolineae bacterium]|nr:response regulator [Anaerolineae bacterium]
AGAVLVFNFVLSFAGLPRRVRWRERAISIPVGATYLALLLSNRVFENVRFKANHAVTYDLTIWGYAGAAFIAVYMTAMIVLLYRRNERKTRALILPTTIMVLGMVLFSTIPIMRDYSVNTIAITVAVIMLGRVVIIFQVFEPLAAVTRELQHKASELELATHAKAQFLANMSHELRTPLNSIIGYTELVGAGTYGDLTEMQRDRLAKVTRNGKRLLALISDVLDLSRLEAGRLELSRSTVYTIDLLDGLLQEFEPQARAKGLSLVRGYSALPPLYVDPNRVHQIFCNLLSNAIKFTTHGVVIVRGYLDATRQQVVISITDTGPGIAPEDQERIFETFQQADGTLSRNHEGTGLGLAITRLLADLHGGSMWFESIVGQGSSFHVSLPIAPDADLLPVAGAPVIEPRIKSHGPLILVIDDDPEAIEVLQDQLEPRKYRVYGACDVNAGLRLAHELKPSLIILDVKMPAMNGWRVLETLRSDPITTRTPVLISSVVEAADTAHNVGADGFLPKPVQPQALIEYLNRLVPRTPAHVSIQAASGLPPAPDADSASTTGTHPEVAS